MLISNANNWLFNWDNVINNLPKGWKAIQLSVIKDIKESDIHKNRIETEDYPKTIVNIEEEMKSARKIYKG